MKQITTAFLIAVFCSFFSQTTPAAAAALVGTGGKTGVYYPVGKALCHMVNQKSSKYGFKYNALKSKGSVSNINAVLKGNIEVGFAQSDRQYEAYNGKAAWRSPGPQKNLRAICSLYSEVITLVASKKSNISSIGELRGKRVNIGHRGSGQYKNAMDVLEAAQIGLRKIKLKKVRVAQSPTLMQEGKIDAFFYTVGHPNKMLRQLSGRTPVSIIPITGSGIDALIRKYPYYAKFRIPSGLYPGASNGSAVQSIGVRATLVTSNKITNHVIYSLTKSLFENFDELKRSHSALRNLNKKQMLKGLSAPIHDGAKLYYREAGLMR